MGVTRICPILLQNRVSRPKTLLVSRFVPVDCIHPTKDEPDYESAEMLYIDPDTCIDCGLCVDECPVKAIFPLEDLPSEWESYVQMNADYYNK